MTNFNDLPCDIKRMIFKVNKDRETAEYERNKKRHESFLCDMEEKIEEEFILESGPHWAITYRSRGTGCRRRRSWRHVLKAVRTPHPS